MTIQQLQSGPMVVLDDTTGGRVQQTTWSCRMTDTTAVIGYYDTGFAVGDQFRMYVVTRTGMSISLGPKNIVPGIGSAPAISSIDATRFLLFFADTNAGSSTGTDRVMVGTVAPDGTISWGTSTFVSSARQNNYNAFYGNDSTDAVICLDGTNALAFSCARAKVGVGYTAYITPLTISGTTVAVGSSITHTAAGNASPLYASVLDSTHVAIGYDSSNNAGTNYNMVANIIGYAGGTITLGTEFPIDNKPGYPLANTGVSPTSGLHSGTIGFTTAGTEGVLAGFWFSTTDSWDHACAIHLHFDTAGMTTSLPEAAPIVFGEQTGNTTVVDYAFLSSLNTSQVVYQSAPYQSSYYWWGSNGNRADLLGLTGGALSTVGTVIRYGDTLHNTAALHDTPQPQAPFYPSGCRMDDSHALFIWTDSSAVNGNVMWGVVVGSPPVLRATPRTSRLSRVGTGP